MRKKTINKTLGTKNLLKNNVPIVVTLRIDHQLKRQCSILKESKDIYQSRGFTLIELLIVMSFIGVILAFAIPNILSLYRGFQDRMVKEDIEKQLNHVGFQAYLNAQNFELTEESAKTALHLPEDVTITIENPIVYRFNGTCKGGPLQVETDWKKWDYLLESPFCFPQLLETHDKP